MHQLKQLKLSDVRLKPFNSLYWDFCFASVIATLYKAYAEGFFQFPLLGFLLCIGYTSRAELVKDAVLSIPFIGIFALHLHTAKQN